ncbi:UNVERIFIED_ORG: hypothetical protein J2W38_007016 [Variovorax paradoxus]|nr:hypothetical protein [Variovorax paradoxus]
MDAHDFQDQAPDVASLQVLQVFFLMKSARRGSIGLGTHQKLHRWKSQLKRLANFLDAKKLVFQCRHPLFSILAMQDHSNAVGEESRLSCDWFVYLAGIAKHQRSRDLGDAVGTPEGTGKDQLSGVTLEVLANACEDADVGARKTVDGLPIIPDTEHH